MLGGDSTAGTGVSKPLCYRSILPLYREHMNSYMCIRAALGQPFASTRAHERQHLRGGVGAQSMRRACSCWSAEPGMSPCPPPTNHIHTSRGPFVSQPHKLSTVLYLGRSCVVGRIAFVIIGQYPCAPHSSGDRYGSAALAIDELKGHLGRPRADRSAELRAYLAARACPASSLPRPSLFGCK